MKTERRFDLVVKADEEEDRGEMMKDSPLPKISTTKRGQTAYHLWLTSEIKEASQYDHWYETLLKAAPDDVVAFHINSPGGYLDTTLQLCDAIQTTPANTVAFIEGGCCSGASMIAMMVDRVEMGNFSYIMIHTGSGGEIGKFRNLVESASFREKWWHDIMHSVYEGFCTKEEIEEILTGRDLWLDAEESMKRFKRRNDVLDAREKARESEMKKTAKIVKKALTSSGVDLTKLAFQVKP